MARRGHPRRGRATADFSAQAVAVAQRGEQQARREAAEARHRAAEAETLLRELVRAIDTAPLSVTVNLNAASQALASGRELLQQAPHISWPPLSRALVDVKRFLEGHRRG